MPLHQTTPSANPLTMGPPPLHWLGAVWWCSNHGVVLPLPSVFVFFLMLFLPLLLNFVLFCSYTLFAHAHFLWRMTWAHWACPHFFASSWAYGSNCCYFLLGWPVGPYFFLFFHLCLFSLYCKLDLSRLCKEMGDVSNSTSE